VALRVEDTDVPDAFVVSGRGELHLTILIENMRREGYEFQVSRPEVIFKIVDGQRMEPVEQVEIEVSEQYQGTVIELLGQRRGQMRDMSYREDGTVNLTFHVPTRGLLGFRQQFMTASRGEGQLNALFLEYQPMMGEISTRALGSLVASESGMTTTFGLFGAQERGGLFIGAGIEVYEGMIIGEHIRERDLEVNCCKKKHLTNMRSSGADDSLRLETPRNLSLDDAVEYLWRRRIARGHPQELPLAQALAQRKKSANVTKNVAKWQCKATNSRY
jgi:GTP-binding protein